MLETKENNIMIDLETLSTSCNALILSIGAVKFDKNGLKQEFHEVIDFRSCLEVGLKTDDKTLDWWDKQSKEAKEQFNVKNKLTISEALFKFSRWIGDNAIVWGNGAAFDNTILSNAYNKCGIEQPWAFWKDRCYRTIKSLNKNVKMNRIGIYHNALDDAKSQALHLIDILNVKIND